MAPGTGASVKLLVSTLSPGFTPSALSARNMAAPQELTATQYFAPTYAAYSCSSKEGSGVPEPCSP